MFNTWIVFLASVQSNLKRKKKLLLLISLVLLQLKGNPGKHLLIKENRWITNYTFSTHNFFVKKNSGIQCIFNSISCIMHWIGKASNLTIPCLSIKFMHHMLIFGHNQAFHVNPLPICYGYIRMNYSEHIPHHKINGQWLIEEQFWQKRYREPP